MRAMNVPGAPARSVAAARSAARGHILGGIFPPSAAGRGTIDDAMRRSTLVTVLLFACLGAVGYLAFSRDPAFVGPVAVGLAAALLAAAIPWHRYPDGFAVVGIVAAALVIWATAVTGLAASPFTALWFVAASLTAVPLPRRLAMPLTLAIALLSLYPFAVERPTGAQAVELAVRAAVLALMGILIPQLMAVVRRAETQAGREQEVSAELRRAQEARKEYMSVLAHELRNPLVAIGAAARVVAKQTAETPAASHANGIVAEVRHSLELLDALTDVSSIESGRLRSALRPVDLGAVLRDAVAAAAVADHETAVEGADRPVVVLGDDRRLGQVVRNLVGNAAKYAPEGTTIEVSIGLTSDRRSAIVKVRDEGPGIPPAERSRLFEKFARLSTAGATRGSGLGLYISREIVRDHSGDLWADWPAGGGTAFTFTVPLADPRPAP